MTILQNLKIQENEGSFEVTANVKLSTSSQPIRQIVYFSNSKEDCEKYIKAYQDKYKK